MTAAAAPPPLLLMTRLQVLAPCTIVVDVGGVYDHDAKRYDHHQVVLVVMMMMLTMILPSPITTQ